VGAVVVDLGGRIVGIGAVQVVGAHRDVVGESRRLTANAA